MVVDGARLAGELRRRRVGRRSLVAAVHAAPGSAWLPAEPRAVPSSLLMLAALSLVRGRRRGS